MSFPRYPRYRDSGVEWLGEVPAHWEVKRLRFVAKLNPSKTELAGVDRSTPVSFLPMEAIGDDGTLNLERERTIAEVESGYTYLREGDVALAKITPCFENGKGAVMAGLTNGIAFGTTELIVVRAIPGEAIPGFLHLLFLSKEFRGLGEARMYGAGGQKRVPDSFLRDFFVAFPPKHEQEAITTFVAEETAKIDTLIAEQRRLIELLKEKRQAFVSHAVTKGLDPSAPTKDSGIEWLGEVPAYWEVLPLKRLVQNIEQGWSPQCESDPIESADEWGVLKVGCVNGGVFRATENKRLPAYLDPIETLGLAADDLLISRANTRELVGSAAVVPEAHPRLLLCDKLYRLRLDAERCTPDFLALYLGSDVARSQIELGATGASSSMQNIGQSTILEMALPLPPTAEQHAIISELRSSNTRTSMLTGNALAAISLLQERRTALISAAVTGKIDVRGAAELAEAA